MTDFDPDIFLRKTVRKDWLDLRDQNYTPNLSVLREEMFIDPQLMPRDETTGLFTPRFTVRDQKASGRCAGFALAALIDLQRSLQSLRRQHSADETASTDIQAIGANIVSADMLYRMAYFHDRYPDLEAEKASLDEGLRTMRSAIKGFYHHGVCFDWPIPGRPNEPKRWQSECYCENGVDRGRLFPTVPQAKTARNIGLGAYYRLASILNHFHAALNDAEAILTSANIHDGWTMATPGANEGIIRWPPNKGRMGTHAFVIVGYDKDGFHVLNSWGPTWGGYKNQAGIALWTYRDWAQNIVDSWVLRLGVHAPQAFGASIGEKGTKGLYAVQSGSTPCFELVGHYMHLDDGFHVTTGSYPSFPKSWDRTRDYLHENINSAPDCPKAESTHDYKGVLVWIPGSLEGIKAAFGNAVNRKNLIKALGLYPYTIFWCNGFVEKSLEVLEGLFDSCEAQAGENAEHLDSLIENRVRGVGRAFWRDIEMGARRVVKGTGELPHEPDEMDRKARVAPGYVVHFLKDLFDLVDETGAELHIVAEGAGALVVHEILAFLEEDAADNQQLGGRAAIDYISSLHLMHPAIGMPRAKKQILPFLEAMNAETKKRGGRIARPGRRAAVPAINTATPPRAQLYIPTSDLEERVHFGAYGKSILHLVARAFEDRYEPPAKGHREAPKVLGAPRTFLGMAKATSSLKGDARKAIVKLTRVQSQHHALDRVPQTVLNNDDTLTKFIFKSVTAARRLKARAERED